MSLSKSEEISLTESISFVDAPNCKTISAAKAVYIIGALTSISILTNLSTGLITIGLPRIAEDIQLADNLLLWPGSVYPLACGCTLLLAGSIADRIGSRAINILGTILIGIFILASGLAHTGIQLIIFRAIQGIGQAMYLPTAISIITENFPEGKQRSLGFGWLGIGQPLGFQIGLVLGGIFEEFNLGWRFAFYLCAWCTFFIAGTNYCFLPQNGIVQRPATIWRALGTEIDWVGAALSTSCLGGLSYIFTIVTGDVSDVKNPENIVLFILAIMMAPAFICWIHRQEKLGRPALVSNSLWRNREFTAICIVIFFTWAVVLSMEWFFNLFFQKVQLLSPIQASIRFIPEVVSCTTLSVLTGYLVHRFQTSHLLFLCIIFSTTSPFLMAIADPTWNWWYWVFWAVLFLALSIDVIYVIAVLIITDVFPPNMQATAGALINTIASFGTSFGIAIMAAISSSVTKYSLATDKPNADALLDGYRAVFWTCLSFAILSLIISVVGLRKIGVIGHKQYANV